MHKRDRVDEPRPNLGQLRSFWSLNVHVRRAKRVSLRPGSPPARPNDVVIIAMQRIERRPIRAICNPLDPPRAGFRRVDEKNFWSTQARRDLTSQASKLRARIEMLRTKRRGFAFARMQITLILSKQTGCCVSCTRSRETSSANMSRRVRTSHRTRVEAFVAHATSTRFVKWSRCFVRSVVIEASCGRFATARFR